ncbi:MAG: PEP-CTERM sorting domain-containing protein [Verrucomicrobiia bacterium]|jgi:hypothetical protein
MKREVKALMLGLAVVGLANWVNAAPTLTISNGANPLITVVDNGAGDLSSLTGVVAVVTNVGVWNLIIDVGETKPALGSITNPVMDLAIQASSTAAATLTLTFSDNGFALTNGVLSASLSGHIVSGAGETVGYFVYADPGNVVGNTITQVTGIGPGPLPISTTIAEAFALTVPYSLTQVVDISTSGPSSNSIDASFQALIPEPSTVALVGLGLVGALAIRRRK